MGNKIHRLSPIVSIGRQGAMIYDTPGRARFIVPPPADALVADDFRVTRGLP